jgi:hypothetical protein
MSQLPTKNGKPLTVGGDDISNSSGRHVGRRRGDTVYDLTASRRHRRWGPGGVPLL